MTSLHDEMVATCAMEVERAVRAAFAQDRPDGFANLEAFLDRRAFLRITRDGLEVLVRPDEGPTA